MAFFVAGVLAVPGLPQRSSLAQPQKNDWQTLEPGLELGSFVSPQKSDYGDSVIRVLRFDLRHFQFRLLNASAEERGHARSVKEWVRRHGLVAGINASMYQKDNRTSVSYMKTGPHVNSSWVSKDKTILAFDPWDQTLPPAMIIDRDCEDFDRLRKQFQSLIQSIRMISCQRENVWSQQTKKWSTAAIGRDGKGRFLFIHVRSPYTTHDLINHLLDLPIDLRRAMYVEGGKDAQLYIHSETREFEFVGSYSTGSNENDENRYAWPVPNVLGIARVPGSR